MPEQLKIIIDADVNKAIAGVQNLSKVITSDFTKATQAASVAATKLSSDVNTSVQKINASLSKKVKAPDLDTSGLLASIKRLESELSKATSDSQFQSISVQLNKLKEDFDRLRGFKIDVDLDVSNVTNDIRELSALIASTKYNIELTGGAEKDAKKLSQAFKEITDLSGRLQEVNSIIKDLSNGVRLPVHEGMTEADIQGLINRLKEEQTALIKSSAAIRERANAILSLPSIKKIADQQKDFTLPLIVSADLRNLSNDINEFAEKRINLNIDTSNFGVLKFDTSKALAGIKEVKSEIASITTKPLNIDTTGVKNAAKLISGDFVQATEKASTAGFNLSERIAAATTRINASIDKMVDDALGGANRLNETFRALKTPNLSFGVLSFDSSKVLAEVEKIKAGIGSIKVAPVNIPINTVAAIERLNILEKELLSLEALKVSPDISSTQLELFEANIKRVKTEIASLKLIVPPVPPNTFKSINDLERELGELQTKINFSKDIGEIRKLGDEFKRLQTQINNIRVAGGLDNQFNKLSTSSRNAANSLRSVPNASNQATLALTNLGRVVQDAPFGFLGIANNLNPLLESFERLKQTSGTTGKALKAVAGSLLGAGGLGFAVSIASSLLITFGSRLFGAGRAAKESAPRINEFAEAAKEAARSFADSATKVTSLVSALSGGTLNLQERKAALDELKNINQEFFGSLREEEGLIKNLQVAYDGYLARLKDIGRTKAIESQLTKLFDRKLQLELSLDPKFISQTDAATQRVLGKMKKELESLGGAVDISKEKFDAFNDTQRRRIELANRISQIQEGGQVRLAGEGVGQAQREINQLNLRIEALSSLLKDTGAFEIKIPKPDTKAFDKFQDDIIARAKLAAEAFGQSFVVPDLEITFFKNKDAVFNDAKDFLGNVKSFLEGNIGALKAKIPVQTEIEFLPVTEGIPQRIIDNFFKGLGADRKIPIEIIPDITISKSSIDAINQKLDLRKQFSILGDLGLKEFNKLFEGIDTNNFAQLSKGIEDATIKLQGMMAVATTLNQAIGQGLTNAFNSVFDAVLEGKNVFKALAEGIKQLIVGTIKAIAQMLILRAVTSFIFPGAGAAGFALPRGQFLFQANPGNFGQLSGIGSRAFTNALTVNVNGQISGDTIRLAGQRAANSQGRFG